MKKFYNSITTALMTVLVLTSLSSCENDKQIAYDLSGEWEGYMGESFYDYWGYENYAEYYTVMRFYRDGRSSYTYGATTGEGEQIDYIRGSLYRPYYRSFTWKVDWGTIYIYYDNGERIRIYDYSINSRYFRGVMEYKDRYGRTYSGTSFDFQKTTNFNWDYYYDWSQNPTMFLNNDIKVEK